MLLWYLRVYDENSFPFPRYYCLRLVQHQLLTNSYEIFRTIATELEVKGALFALHCLFKLQSTNTDSISKERKPTSTMIEISITESSQIFLKKFGVNIAFASTSNLHELLPDLEELLLSNAEIYLEKFPLLTSLQLLGRSKLYTSGTPNLTLKK